ncbi:MAG: sigma-70 family RNA polymerase sigma factor [Bacteroidia bacterium]
MKTQVVSVSDQELIKRYLAGKEHALGVLIQRHKSRVYTAIYLMVKNRNLAEDIFQDTFVKVIDTLKGGRYNEEGKFLPWVLRIAHNLCIDHFRKQAKMPTVSPDDDYDPFAHLDMREGTIEDRIMKSQSHEKLRRLIQELPEEQREVLVMRIYGGLSFKEIAEATQVSINTSLGRMRYALGNIRKLIDQYQLNL